MHIGKCSDVSQNHHEENEHVTDLHWPLDFSQWNQSAGAIASTSGLINILGLDQLLFHFSLSA